MKPKRDIFFGVALLVVIGGFLLAPQVCAQAMRAQSAEPATNWQSLLRVVSLADFNTRVVVLGTALLGIASGVIGSFTLLRKRALMGDALSHATLPGIALAFIVSVWLGLSGKSLPILLAGAAVFGVLGLLAVLLIGRLTRLKEDTALGIVLSVFFGGGVALLGIAQQLPTANAAGLESFIYGKAASMVVNDVLLIAAVSICVIVTCALLFKEFRLLCFDSPYAAATGWPTLWLDVVMMALVVLVTVVGLQAVGLILVIAMLIIPAAAARFWTEDLGVMAVVAGVTGGISGLAGAMVSAVAPNLPSGAMIVLVSGVVFLISMFLGKKRGLLVRWRRQHLLARRVSRQHVLRAAYELLEDGVSPNVRAMLPMRSWNLSTLRKQLRQAEDDGLIDLTPGGAIVFSPEGLAMAERMVRNHRLWELFLIRHADIAASHVDRDADAIEHILGHEMVQSLEAALADEERASEKVPASPHVLQAEAKLADGASVGGGSVSAGGGSHGGGHGVGHGGGHGVGQGGGGRP